MRLKIFQKKSLFNEIVSCAIGAFILILLGYNIYKKNTTGIVIFAILTLIFAYSLYRSIKQPFRTIELECEKFEVVKDNTLKVQSVIPTPNPKYLPKKLEEFQLPHEN